MPDWLSALLDPGALAWVFGGTLLATLARCGLRDARAAGRALLGLLRPRFDEVANRAALSRAVTDFERRGYLCADLPPPPDAPLAAALDAYRRSGSPQSITAYADANRSGREQRHARAVQPFDHAGELAPVFGMAGTLLAIAQLVPNASGDGAVIGGDPSATIAAIASAVLSSLYGVVAAHLLFIPLGRAIDRRFHADEQQRDRLVRWFVQRLERGDRRGDLPSLRDAA